MASFSRSAPYNASISRKRKTDRKKTIEINSAQGTSELELPGCTIREYTVMKNALKRDIGEVKPYQKKCTVESSVENVSTVNNGGNNNVKSSTENIIQKKHISKNSQILKKKVKVDTGSLSNTTVSETTSKYLTATA